MPMLKARKGEKPTSTAVRTEMTKMKEGKLHSGSKAGKKVTNPKQAIAIGLSEARKKGEKMPMKKEKAGSAVMAFKKKSNKDAHRLKRNIGRR
jgi:hypothetical protein